MSARSLLVLACVSLASVARAQEEPPTAPLAGRPTRFSHLVGRFTVEASVAPDRVAVETPTTLTVRIRGTPADGVAPKRESLRLFADDVEESFFVEPAPAEDRAEPGVWTFVWRLRPKATSVSATPELSLVHYLPGLRRFQTTTAEPLPLRVTERASTQLPLRAVPEHLREPASIGAVHRSTEAWYLGAAATLLVACLAALFVWRFPTPRVSADNAATRALAQLTADPSQCREAVASYFRERWNITDAEPLGPAIDARLRRAGVSASIREVWSAWCYECDVRFAPSADASEVPLFAEAVGVADLIRRTEADAWRR